mmetsp:Transcript_7163/g.22588  ORF Transcript_7163/g.22588 Transcript_7163/m.22588 type:complete len:142 (+) Transcript_7163:74-499(+)
MFKLLAFATSVVAFTKPRATRSPVAPLQAVELANGAVSFDRVCREWRCKYSGDKVTSESLEACCGVLAEYLPEIKKMEGVTVNRLICGGCLDFKVMVTQPLEGYGPWEEAGHPPEADFIAKLKAIDGVSQVETQTITNMVV